MDSAEEISEGVPAITYIAVVVRCHLLLVIDHDGERFDLVHDFDLCTWLDEALVSLKASGFRLH